ncbi:DUF4349 domain-containing protein [Infirmifilum sp. NZ]|uniref:DUF4349 domain-containing protein n=1 Tax=Infirmifilum sp. NZ TaxID=2926850 RepID=UPI0027A80570|nr:DUF4349 domain-containing protein [Infirmifilum sp. NZ]UNQ73427.1 DUF4349 domain-containing protein [Infirmifilum sp. NZ]
MRRRVLVASALLAAFLLAATLYLLLAPNPATTVSQQASTLPLKEAAQQTTVKPAAPSAPASTPSVSQRNITYSAEVEVSVENVSLAVTRAKSLAGETGGYVASVQLEASGGGSATVTLKVPASNYRRALDALSGLGRVDRVVERALDVTDQWVDLSARLRNLRAEEERLLQLLDKASSVSNVLQVEDRLSYVRYQIEFYDAQLRNLERSVVYATITVTFKPSSNLWSGPRWT